MEVLMTGRIATLIATWFGSSLIGPGTLGSAAAIPLCYAAAQIPWRDGRGALYYFAIAAVVFVLGLWSVPGAQARLGPRIDGHGEVKERDQGQIVIDEVLGMLITTSPFIWFAPQMPAWWGYALAFACFRTFDIVKPWPVRYFDRKKTAAGVMLDDVAAGVWAALVMILLRVVIGAW
jgi:phosphatidylglycerophosphatase A